LTAFSAGNHEHGQWPPPSLGHASRHSDRFEVLYGHTTTICLTDTVPCPRGQ